jgi:hypothetical protein
VEIAGASEDEGWWQAHGRDIVALRCSLTTGEPLTLLPRSAIASSRRCYLTSTGVWIQH